MPRKPREDGRNSRTVANNKYNQSVYERLAINVYKGNREKVKEYAESIGETTNTLVNKLLAREIDGFKPIEGENKAKKSEQYTNETNQEKFKESKTTKTKEVTTKPQKEHKPRVNMDEIQKIIEQKRAEQGIVTKEDTSEEQEKRKKLVEIQAIIEQKKSSAEKAEQNDNLSSVPFMN